jgi:hypothetical protein
MDALLGVHADATAAAATPGEGTTTKSAAETTQKRNAAPTAATQTRSEITIDEFGRIDLRIARIVSAEAV